MMPPMRKAKQRNRTVNSLLPLRSGMPWPKTTPRPCHWYTIQKRR
ncbi:hypothetical protein L915_12514 [Phytophthora nicotianae]|uniref:Uncharacterized protein n=1 Tax=Phytophthora nicotianae TaxID=4792 RepID=W2GGD9_PHYNI|nr:hypothetical protein L915_12514 [Phytophthora nicotianae]